MGIEIGVLGKKYADREIICSQGESGNCMFVIQSGKVEVVREESGNSIVVGRLGQGDIFGEMAIFDRQPRSATVRASGEAQVLTLDKRAFLRRVHDDPSLAFRILERMSLRIRDLNQELSRLRRNAS